MKALKEKQKTRLICLAQLALIGVYLYAVFCKEINHTGRINKK